MELNISQMDAQLRREKEELMDELLKRALAQNPDIAKALVANEAGQSFVKRKRQEEYIATYEKIEEQRLAEHRANRHIAYDDRRNRNALVGLRRSLEYRHSTRKEQLGLEKSMYYDEYGIIPPVEWWMEYLGVSRIEVSRIEATKYAMGLKKVA